ncbi:hypothetical protein IEO21_04195 [Rhodonia placenta]|uniref:Secreted protein n=2 Tax=Rhodonia placenta TaxID=104341 RepID=A0A1X6MVI2_9APHY|nr:hypothetical protein POSPLADRAFT_1148141 [Postia placenta MAD-698-R-SB12]KAF9816330.1 hypothetical protein IEO21_04195 [Postia placenta]OSX60385.1 hypothetical protein POSPLADRAFT_1148141 [Postia placenta MAD-698-R-SB12]
MFLLSLFGSFILCCVLFPSIWTSITGGDELDAHEMGIALVASRTPFRETGPPACMAKLIMLRHKIHQDKTKRRCNVTRVRQAAFTYSIPVIRPHRDVAWMRFGRARGKQIH